MYELVKTGVKVTAIIGIIVFIIATPFLYNNVRTVNAYIDDLSNTLSTYFTVVEPYLVTGRKLVNLFLPAPLVNAVLFMQIIKYPLCYITVAIRKVIIWFGG